jgi:hypothetical protein
LLGFAEISQGEIEAVRKRLAAMERLHSESKDQDQLKYIDYLRNILLGEVSIAEDSFDETIAIFNELPFHFKNILSILGIVKTTWRWGTSRRISSFPQRKSLGHSIRQRFRVPVMG